MAVSATDRADAIHNFCGHIFLKIDIDVFFSVAQLAMVVPAESPQAAVFFDNGCEIKPAGDAGHVVHHLMGLCLKLRTGVFAVGIRADVAHLPVLVVPPHPQAAVVFNGGGMVLAAAYRAHVGHDFLRAHRLRIIIPASGPQPPFVVRPHVHKEPSLVIAAVNP